MRRHILLGLLCICATTLRAQLYTGMSGLVHVPSAEMNKEFTPDGKGFAHNGAKYNTTDY